MIINYFVHIVWDVNPKVFEGFEIPRWYSIFWVLGLTFCFYVMQKVYKSEHMNVDKVHDLAFYLILGGIIGARLGHILFYDFEYYWNHPIEVLPIKLSPSFQFTGLAGLASHGGGIGALIALFLYCRKYKDNFLFLLDRIVIVIPLLGFFIRMGNLMNSEIIGTPTTVPWAFIFKRVDLLPRHPAQLYEAIFCLILFFVLYTIWKSKKYTFKNGLLSGFLFLILFTQRFIDEFFKINQVDFENGLILNMGQILSIPYIIFGIVILYQAKYKKLNS